MMFRWPMPLFLLFAMARSAFGCGGAKAEPQRAVARGCPSDMAEVRTSSRIFCIDKTETTTAAYLECVGKGVCTAMGTGKECSRDTLGEQENPINCVDASQAETYCAFREKRLPTDAEWDQAVRAHAPSDAGICSSIDMPRRSPCKTTRSGAEDNGAGVRDLRGNVAEWTSTGDEEARIVRGGSYDSSNRNDFSADMRRAIRPGTRHPGLGFRCAKDY